MSEERELDQFLLSAILCRFSFTYKKLSFFHREHAILLSRERVNRVNKGTKRVNSSPVVLSYTILLGKPLLTNPE